MRSALFALAVGAAVGCGASDPLNRQEVSGTATFKGKPIGYGTVSLVPMDGQQTRGSAEIKDGKFKIEKEGGLSPGKYAWTLFYPDPPPDFNPPPDAPPGGRNAGKESKNLIPKEYATGTANTIEVKGGDKNVVELSVP